MFDFRRWNVTIVVYNTKENKQIYGNRLQHNEISL